MCSEGILKALQQKPFSVALIVLAGLLLASQASYAAGSVGGLPKEGDQVAPEWRVEKLATHPEFHRFVLRHEDGATTGVEVTHRRSTEGQAAVYVVQPAPGESPPAALLDAFRARLKSLPKPGELTKRVVMEKASEKSSLSLYAWLLVLVLVLGVFVDSWLRGRPVSSAVGGARAAVHIVGAAGVAGVALLYFTWSSGPAPLHMDTARDIYMGRTCGSPMGCPRGAITSLEGVYQGTLWPRLVGSGLSLSSVQLIVAAASAAGVALLFWLGTRMVSVFVGVGAAGLFAAFVLAAQGEPAVLWHPSLLALPVAAFTVALAQVVLYRSVATGAVAAVALAISMEGHIVAVAMLPAWLAVVVLWAERPLVTAGVGGLLWASLHVALSPGTAESNVTSVSEALGTTGWLGLVVIGAGAVLLLRWVRRRFGSKLHGGLSLDRRIVVALACVLVADLVLILAGLAVDKHQTWRFQLPAAAAAALAVAVMLHRRPWLAAGTGVVAAAVALVSSVTAARPGADWTMSDVEAVGRVLQSRGYTYEELVRGLRSPNPRRLLIGLSLYVPAQAEGERGQTREVTVLRLPGGNGPAPSPPRWSEVGLGDGVAVIREGKGWLRDGRARACVRRQKSMPGARDACVPGNRRSVPRSRDDVPHPVAGWSVGSEAPKEAYELRWVYPLNPKGPARRHFIALPPEGAAGENCEWSVQIGNGGGPAHRAGDEPLVLDRDRLGRRATVVFVSRRSPESCPRPLPQWPPDYLEWSDGEPALDQLLAR